MQNREPTQKYPLVYIIGLCCLLFTVIAIISIMASVPPVSRDALIHHLTIPKLYLKHGGIYEIPSLWFSYLPMNVTLLYAIPLYFDNDIVPKFIHFAFALATAALIYRYLSRRLDQFYALLGALFFLSVPVIVRLSTTAYVDLGLIFFLFASLLFLFDWIESGFKIKYLVISAIFCGLALGTKYNGLIGLFLLGFFVPFVYSRYNHAKEKQYAAKAIGFFGVFIVVSTIVFSPWMIRNISWTGNPLHPLFKGLLSTSAQSASIDEAPKKSRPDMNHLQIRRDIYGESTLEIALIPVRVFFQGEDDDPKNFDGKLNPFLLLLPIFAFFGIKGVQRQVKTEKMMMLFFSVFFLLIACAQISIRVRYFSPIIPSLVVLSMFGLYHFDQKLMEIRSIAPGIKKFIIFGIILVMLGLNAMYIGLRFHIDQPMFYITGKISRDEYIQAFRPEYASMQYANRHLSETDKILGIYIGDRGYYSDIPIAFSIYMLQDFAAEAKSAQDISRMLHQKKITHLLINYGLFNTYSQYYSTHEKRILGSFFEQYTIVAFEKDDHGLMRILITP